MSAVDFNALLRHARSKKNANSKGNELRKANGQFSRMVKVSEVELQERQYMDCDETGFLKIQIDASIQISRPDISGIHSLNKFKLRDGLFVVPEYITPECESWLIDTIVRRAPNSCWRRLPTTGRRLQMWGGIPSVDISPREIPRWLKELFACIEKDFSNEFPAGTMNHALINEYYPGQGIHPHKDGPAYFPKVAILSLGSGASMQFGNRLEDFTSGAADSESCISLYLPARSLLIFSGEFYSAFYHSISNSEVDFVDESVLNLSHCDISPNTAISRTNIRYSLTLRQAFFDSFTESLN